MKVKEKDIVTFEDSAIEDILKIFEKEIDDEGYIIEKDTKERVLTPDGEEVHINEFAGIQKSSEIFIKSDLISIIKLADRMEM